MKTSCTREPNSHWLNWVIPNPPKVKTPTFSPGTEGLLRLYSGGLREHPGMQISFFPFSYMLHPAHSFPSLHFLVPPPTSPLLQINYSSASLPKRGEWKKESVSAGVFWSPRGYLPNKHSLTRYRKLGQTLISWLDMTTQ